MARCEAFESPGHCAPTWLEFYPKSGPGGSRVSQPKTQVCTTPGRIPLLTSVCEERLGWLHPAVSQLRLQSRGFGGRSWPQVFLRVVQPPRSAPGPCRFPLNSLTRLCPRGSDGKLLQRPSGAGPRVTPPPAAPNPSLPPCYIPVPRHVPAPGHVPAQPLCQSAAHPGCQDPWQGLFTPLDPPALIPPLPTPHPPPKNLTSGSCVYPANSPCSGTQQL